MLGSVSLRSRHTIIDSTYVLICSVAFPGLLSLLYLPFPLRYTESPPNMCSIQEGGMGIVVGSLWVGDGEGDIPIHFQNHQIASGESIYGDA